MAAPSPGDGSSGNKWIDVVEAFGNKTRRFEAAARMTDGRIGARANRGRKLNDEKMEALIWGLSHENAVVRRCCLEFLDTHPSDKALPHILRCLDDPVPRVRWHAVHALICDACKPGASYVSGEALSRIQALAADDPNPRVRKQARWGLSEAGVLPDGALPES